MTALELIAAERERQIGKGFTTQHDDRHNWGELPQAAMVYADSAYQLVHCERKGLSAEKAISDMVRCYTPSDYDQEIVWPWLTQSGDAEGLDIQPDPLLNCVKAAALLVAEIERLQRLRTDNCNAQSRPTDDTSNSSPGTSPGVSSEVFR